MTAVRSALGLRWACAGSLLLALSLQAAHAGRSCDAPQPPKATMVQSAMTLAERTAKALDASGAQVVVLARAGQDLSKYNLRYSHLGLAYKQPDGQGGHVWRVLHKLNQCGTSESAIYRQGLGDFFLDDLWRFEAAWVVPNSAVQASLLALLNDPVRSLQLHHKPYNMLAYPWSQKYQQSNQWALETMAVALSADAANMAGASRSFAQAWLQGNGYQPTVLNIGAMTRLGARVSKANIAFDDHPNDKRFSDRIETVTVDSVFTWMSRAGLGATPVRLGL